MDGDGAGVAADQDVSVQQDHSEQGARPCLHAQGRRGHLWHYEAVTWTAATQMGQLPARKGKKNISNMAS